MARYKVRSKCKKWGVIDRVTHWLLFLSIPTLIFSGLPVFDNAHFGWLTWALGGPDARALIHRGASILLAAAVLIHVVYGAYRLLKVVFKEEGRIDVMFMLRDARDMLKIAKHWFGLSKEYPELGFHHPGEKGVYLAVALGIALTGPTGIFMWFDLLPQYQNVWALLHELGFMLISIVITGHFILAITPTNWSVLRAMFTNGWVSEKWARHHMGWWREQCLVEEKPGEEKPG